MRRGVSKPTATVDLVVDGDAALATVTGLVDEQFSGIAMVPEIRTLVIDVSKMTRMTSFGVRQWLSSMAELSRSLSDLYLLGCPTFFVDQLNMVLNFGGSAKVLTVLAPYMCRSCGTESGEAIDVLAQSATLAKAAPGMQCSRCGGALEFDETPQSYFAFLGKYGPSSISPAAARFLAARGLYTSTVGPEKPHRIVKLVHGTVTYFRIIGSISSSFRARPFLVGTEGEAVLDLAEVERFDPSGLQEWRRLLKTLSRQVSAVALVDVNESFLTHAGDSLAISRNIAVASLLAPYACLDCQRTSQESESLADMDWPLSFADRVCPTCGGTTRNKLSTTLLTPLQKASTRMSPASGKVVERRDELLSRAVVDAAVAQAGASGHVRMLEDEMILGKYKVVRRLSAGGMAEVFLANQIGIGGFEKPVAIKRIQSKLLESRKQAIELFLNEAKIAGRLMHPNIVQVLDVGESGGALYLAMEYVRGKDLREVVKTLSRKRALVPLSEALYIVREIAHALHYAYWSTDLEGKPLTVVHRDVSPHNVIIGYDGTVKLLDFGVASSAITEPGESMIVGKWTYMSPETAANGNIDHRSDLFSLGVILYSLCSGVMPFTGNQPKEIVRKIRAGQFTRLEEVAPHLPARLTELVHRMLSPSPKSRPQQGREVVDELNEIARAHALESSGQSIAEFLNRVSPSSAVHDPLGMCEIIRGDALDSVEPRTMSPLTPSARTRVTSPSMTVRFSNRTSQSITVSPPTSSDGIPERSMSERSMSERSIPEARIPVAPRSSRRVLLVVFFLIVLAGGAYVAWLNLGPGT
jgi:eukaryotic-like serine/threonine-protein kinase